MHTVRLRGGISEREIKHPFNFSCREALNLPHTEKAREFNRGESCPSCEIFLPVMHCGVWTVNECKMEGSCRLSPKDFHSWLKTLRRTEMIPKALGANSDARLPPI